MKRNKPIFITLLVSVFLIALYLYFKHTHPSTNTDTIMVCLAIFTAVAFFLEYHQNNKLNEAQFVIELNNQFLNEGKMPTVEFDLERYFVSKRKETVAAELRSKYGPDKEAHQDLVNYLVHLEGIADLVNNGMLRLSSIHDLMAYRFFIAVNNPVVRELELDEFPEYYQGIHALYPVWMKLMKSKNVPIPLEYDQA